MIITNIKIIALFCILKSIIFSQKHNYVFIEKKRREYLTNTLYKSG
jgi:hypothetical protein